MKLSPFFHWLLTLKLRFDLLPFFSNSLTFSPPLEVAIFSAQLPVPSVENDLCGCMLCTTKHHLNTAPYRSVCVPEGIKNHTYWNSKPPFFVLPQRWVGETYGLHSLCVYVCVYYGVFNQSLVVAVEKSAYLHQYWHELSHHFHSSFILRVYTDGKKLVFSKDYTLNPVSKVCSFRGTSTSLSCKWKAEPQQKFTIWCKNLLGVLGWDISDIGPWFVMPWYHPNSHPQWVLKPSYFFYLVPDQNLNLLNTLICDQINKKLMTFSSP